MTTGSNVESDAIKIAPKKIVRGIPCFEDSDYFYSEMSLEETLELADLAATLGWKKAVSEWRRSAFVRRYITNTQRLLFLSILPIKEGDRVLDVGAGWGNLAAQIAKGFPSSSVYATDKALERLFFAEQVKEQERLDNLRVIQSDITDLPFEKGFFDVVIMIGVLEWLGASVKTMSPRAAQERGLKAIYDIMRPGGRLLIGIENRIGYHYFLGRADHSGRAFTSLMPRRVADFYMGMRGERGGGERGKGDKGPYRTYTYSRGGYNQLLKQVGFKSVKFYAVLPDYRFPTDICELDMLKQVAQHRATKSFPKPMLKLLPSGIIGALTPSFYMVAEK